MAIVMKMMVGMAKSRARAKYCSLSIFFLMIMLEFLC